MGWVVGTGSYLLGRICWTVDRPYNSILSRCVVKVMPMDLCIIPFEFILRFLPVVPVRLYAPGVKFCRISKTQLLLGIHSGFG